MERGLDSGTRWARSEALADPRKEGGQGKQGSRLGRRDGKEVRGGEEGPGRRAGPAPRAGAHAGGRAGAERVRGASERPPVPPPARPAVVPAPDDALAPAHPAAPTAAGPLRPVTRVGSLLASRGGGRPAGVRASPARRAPTPARPPHARVPGAPVAHQVRVGRGGGGRAPGRRAGGPRGGGADVLEPHPHSAASETAPRRAPGVMGERGRSGPRPGRWGRRPPCGCDSTSQPRPRVSENLFLFHLFEVSS